MRGDRDDASAHLHLVAGPASPGLRTLGLVAGSVLAVVATVVVFLTDDPRVLRLAVVAAAWGFVLAALVASRRSPDGTAAGGGELATVERAAAEREAELRLAYELELEREVAGRREHELRVENELRRTDEQSMRTELAALRAELASVGELRREVAQLAGLRREVAELAGLRQDLDGLTELRTALAGLDLAALAELRTDVGRLRAEVTEQLSGEMLVERVMLRTQSTRTAPAAPAGSAPRTVEADGWTSSVPEPTAAVPAVRADESDPGTHQVAAVRAEPRRAPTPPPPPPHQDWLAGRSLIEPDAAAEACRTRHATAAEPTPPALDRPADRSLPTLPTSGETESGRRTDAPAPAPAPDELLTTERPSPQRQRPPVPAPTAGAPVPAAEDPGRRLADLLADSGLTPPSGGRRRRRYREDDETDDVLARVLGRD